MPRVLRILNRINVGGPVLNAFYLTKYLAPEFETELLIGEKEDHEASAAYMAEDLGIHYTIIPEMGRSINLGNDFSAFRKLRSFCGNVITRFAISETAYFPLFIIYKI